MQLLQQEMSMIYTTSSHDTVYFVLYWQDIIRYGRGLFQYYFCRPLYIFVKATLMMAVLAEICSKFLLKQFFVIKVVVFEWIVYGLTSYHNTMGHHLWRSHLSYTSLSILCSSLLITNGINQNLELRITLGVSNVLQVWG